MTTFHEGKKPWAKIKHNILGTYLPLFIGKTRLFQKHVYLVDGFAGQGKYDNGEPGSAMISANISMYPVTESSRGIFRCINVEKDPVCFAKLEEATKEHSKRGFVRNINGEFERELPAILKSIDGKTAIFFIDPFGTEGAKASTLKLISERDGVTEALIRFDDARVKRLIGFNKSGLFGMNQRALKTEEKFAGRVAELTREQGVEATLSRNPEAGRIIVEEYINLIVKDLDLFKFGLAYPVVNPLTLGHHYYLAHFCDHEDGYTYMANFMAKVQRTVEKLSAQKTEFELFGGSNEQAELMGFREEIVKVHEEGKIDAIVRQLPGILREKGWLGKTVQRRHLYAAIVEKFGWTVLLKESKKALQAAQAAGLLILKDNTDSSDVEIHSPKP